MADSCYKCLAKGHNCDGQTTDPENSRPLCVFCEDGVDCPVTQRLKREASAPVVTETKTRPSAPRRSNVDGKVEIKTMDPKEKRFCSIGGCNAVLRSNNRTGRCATHSYVKQADRPETSSAESTHECESRNCDKQIPLNKRYCSSRCNNLEWAARKRESSSTKPSAGRGGKRGYRGTRKPSPSGIPAGKYLIHTGNEPAVDPTFALQLTEPQIDGLLSGLRGLPAATKVRVLQAALAATV